MDPNQCLEDLLTQARFVVKQVDGETYQVRAEDAEYLAERIIALNEWIVKGGFLPKAWDKKGAGK